MVKVVIAGGGTGGHFFPGLAVAQTWKERDRDAQVVFVGTSKGIEARYVPKTQFDLELMDAPALKGKGLLGVAKGLFKMPFALLEALNLLKKIGPDLILGVGGYASGPIALVSWLSGIPVFVMEQNAHPGMANRVLGKFAKKVFITFPESEAYFPKKKVVLSGNPVRAVMKGVRELRIDKDKYVILCFGGSQGALTINGGVVESLKYLDEIKNKLHFIHQIGRNQNLEDVKRAYSEAGISAEVLEFIDNMEEKYSAASLVISRAGATTLSELTMTGRPAILIPFLHATDDHQTKNAKWIAAQGGAIVINEKDLTGELLARQIKTLFSDETSLKQMATTMKKMSTPQAADLIIDECCKYIGEANV
ncbi:undecaprenyldiphospho-muramoylpentapeptide beta-N-acetylglucosaminyltransferase [bacterium]|nr:undecaprenyldiphospho-muramoylpentapeptide beta-N-acetylglucosaminyltransferase [bacterium]